MTPGITSATKALTSTLKQFQPIWVFHLPQLSNISAVTHVVFHLLHGQNISLQ